MEEALADFGKARNRSIAHFHSCFRGSISRAQTRAAGCEYDIDFDLVGETDELVLDSLRFVRKNFIAADVERVFREIVAKGRTAEIFLLAGRASVAYC